MRIPRSFLTLSLLWLAGVGLRLTVLALPPVIAVIIAEFHLSGTEVGLLNAIPVFLFALIAVPGSLLITRFGAVPALIAGLLIAAAGSALRGFALDTFLLYAGTIVMGCGIAVMQPALPSIVPRWMPDRIGFSTAVYTNGLLFGEIFPVALTALTFPLVGNSWRAELIIWSVSLAIIALVIFLFQPGGSKAAIGRPRRWMPSWNDPLLWKIGLLVGGTSQLYFCSNAFLPGYLLQAGKAELIGPTLTALNCSQIPASFALLVMASRLERKNWPFPLAGLLGLCGIAVILSASATWQYIVGAGLIGFSCAALLTLSLALPALLVAAPDVPRTSAGTFAIGYGASMAMSLLCGLAWDFTQNAAFAFLPIAIGVSPILLFVPLTDLSTRRSEPAEA